jgi:TPR repeat protein
MQLLGGRNGQVDMPEALRLLWIAVEKGNANAELELAEMYWRGRGVIQNCDQALILLTAATRKGSAEAQRRLQEFQKQGCE